MDRVTFFFEIGGEEIPAGYIKPALEAMKLNMKQFFESHRIECGSFYVAGTPRRLVMVVYDVAVSQTPSVQEIVGPPYNVAFGEDGSPTKAAEGFARSQNISINDLKVKETPKGKYVYVVKEEKGLPTKELLEKFLPDFIAHIPFPKSMRWGSQTVSFARPLHWIVALLGDDVLSFNYGTLKSGRKSRGHRFMKPDEIVVPSDFEKYRQILKDHFVILDIDERKKLIKEGVQKLASQVEGTIIEDEALLDEVTNLVEYVYPVMGKFDEVYLDLPPEVPITVMKEHQRYFAVTDFEGNLLPYFITISNTVPRKPELVVEGNERVVRARLEDARFYYEEDKKIPLDDRAEELKNVVFHSRLGTSWEKVERFTQVAKWIAEKLGFSESALNKLLRAAHLCKADLVTGMVGEFPELQGIMGRAYALQQKEDPEVAEAIYEHYLPDRAGGPVPAGMIGAVLSIADKIDTIVGCFGVGLIPTGTADPFALRRQTLGILRIILEKEWDFSIGELIDVAIPGLKRWITEPEDVVKKGVLNFFNGRLQHYLETTYNYPSDVIDSVISAGSDSPVDIVRRVEALAKFKERADFEVLATAFKRVVNIIKKPEETLPNAELFEEPAERELWDLVVKSKQEFDKMVSKGDYVAALEILATLKAGIDKFFDSVLVMAEDERIKRNRLALLTQIKNMFDRIADFKKIQV